MSKSFSNDNEMKLIALTKIIDITNDEKKQQIDYCKICSFLENLEETKQLLQTYLVFYDSIGLKQSKPVIDKQGRVQLVTRFYRAHNKETNEWLWTEADVVNNKGETTNIKIEDLVEYTRASQVLYGKG